MAELFCEQCGTDEVNSVYARGDLYLGAYCDDCMCDYLFAPLV